MASSTAERSLFGAKDAVEQQVAEGELNFGRQLFVPGLEDHKVNDVADEIAGQLNVGVQHDVQRIDGDQFVRRENRPHCRMVQIDAVVLQPLGVLAVRMANVPNAVQVWC